MTTNTEGLKPCAEQLREDFNYDPETGLLTWKVNKRRHVVREGQQCGYSDTNGRRRVEYNGRSYAVHQIAYAIHHGRWAPEQVDHINGDKQDNRISNLREATNAENSRNRNNPANTSGYKGVTFHKRQSKFNARIMVSGLMFNLGTFDTATAAAKAYNSAAIKHHGHFALLNHIEEDHGQVA